MANLEKYAHRANRIGAKAQHFFFCMMIAFSIIYGIVRQIVDGIFGGLMGANLLAGITLSIIIYYIFNLMQHFSTQVLIAQYATEIGIRGDRYDPEKDKVDGF